MATPNNVTPTNCSWWPISALENDAGKSTEGEENQDPTDPALKSQDRLVLYHWTQSFSSQKVKKNNLSAGFPGRNHLQSPGHPLHGEGEGLVPRAGEGSSLWPGSSFVPAVLHFNSICLGRERGRGGSAKACFCFGIVAGAALALCSLTAPLWRGQECRQRLSRALGPPCHRERGRQPPSRAPSREQTPARSNDLPLALQ